MAYLHPQLGIAGGSSVGHRLETRQAVFVLRAVNDNIAGPLQVATVHLDVARQQSTGAAVRPAALQFDVTIGGSVERVGETLGHRALDEAVLYSLATG